MDTAPEHQALTHLLRAAMADVLVTTADHPPATEAIVTEVASRAELGTVPELFYHAATAILLLLTRRETPPAYKSWLRDYQWDLRALFSLLAEVATKTSGVHFAQAYLLNTPLERRVFRLGSEARRRAHYIKKGSL